jgi:hypothetical protein
MTYFTSLAYVKPSHSTLHISRARLRPDRELKRRRPSPSEQLTCLIFKPGPKVKQTGPGSDRFARKYFEFYLWGLLKGKIRMI